MVVCAWSVGSISHRTPVQFLSLPIVSCKNQISCMVIRYILYMCIRSYWLTISSYISMNNALTLSSLLACELIGRNFRLGKCFFAVYIKSLCIAGWRTVHSSWNWFSLQRLTSTSRMLHRWNHLIKETITCTWKNNAWPWLLVIMTFKGKESIKRFI